jgi:hypothetical protein
MQAEEGSGIEHLAFRKRVFFNERNIEGDVLPLAARIREPEIRVLHVVVLDQFHYVFRRRHGYVVLSLAWPRGLGSGGSV